MATYADNTAVLSPGHNPAHIFEALQNHLNLIENWSSSWRIEINSEKYNHRNKS